MTSIFAISNWLFLCVATIAGCSAPSAPTSRPAPPSARIITQPATSPSIPFRYMSGVFRPAAFPDAAARQLLDDARRVRPGSAIWFVLFTDSRLEAEYWLVAEIYFVPEIQSPQLRRGTWIRLVARPPAAQETFDPEDVMFHAYVQIAPRDRPFSRVLDVPEPGIYLPFEPTWQPKKDPQRIALIQAFYDVMQDPYHRSDRNSRIVRFSSTGEQMEVGYGRDEYSGQYISFEPQADGMFQSAGSGSWAMP